MGALSGLRVLDLSRVLAGPWASQTLADLGANVLKVERPGSGDDTRGWGPPWLTDTEGESHARVRLFSVHQSRQALGLYRHGQPEGRGALRDLAAGADVLIENFKVGAPRATASITHAGGDNPRLIYCSITGFGQNGPLATRPGYDFLVQAMGGLMSVTGAPDGEGGGPQKVGVALTDVMTGLYATVGILAALRERERSGQGQQVDLALLDVTAATLANQATTIWSAGKRQRGWATRTRTSCPTRALPPAIASSLLRLATMRSSSAWRRCWACRSWPRSALPDNAARVAPRRAGAQARRLFCRADAAHWLASFWKPPMFPRGRSTPWPRPSPSRSWLRGR
jgi:crotonobetainyl-CoA:carnitine CoA-transferase CaiB-like acyl-CoA transferase